MCRTALKTTPKTPPKPAPKMPPKALHAQGLAAPGLGFTAALMGRMPISHKRQCMRLYYPPVIPNQHTPGPATHAFWLQLRPLCELHISLQPPNSNSGPGGRDHARPCMWACSQRQLEAAFTCFWRWPCGVCVGRWAKGKAHVRTRGCPPVSIAHRRPKLKPIRSTVPCALVPGSPWT